MAQAAGKYDYGGMAKAYSTGVAAYFIAAADEFYEL